jgi:predicted dinucleotide-binding enzyme
LPATTRAKGIVAALIDQIGFDTVDVGSLIEGRSIEAGAPDLACSGARTLFPERLR